MQSDELPDWVISEIQNAKFTNVKTLDGTGYILELYDKDSKADMQLYEPIEDGRHIITMDLPDDIDAKTLERGIVYRLTFDQHKAPLSKKTVEYLLKERKVGMEAIYRFGLRSLELVDTGADDNQ